MKKLQSILALLLLIVAFPTLTSAISVGMDRYIVGGLRTLYSGDKLLIGSTATTTNNAALEVNGNVYASTYIATSTTATSTFSNGLNVTGGCLAVNSSCITAGSSYPFTTVTNYGVTTSATNTPIWAQAGLMASSTSRFVNASTTQFTSLGQAWFNTFVGIGTTPDTSALLDVHQSGNTIPMVQAQDSGASSATSGGIFQATLDNGTAPVSGTRIGGYQFSSDIGDAVKRLGAAINALATETWTTTANGTQLKLNVTANGTAVRTTAILIDQNANVGLGTTTPGAKLSVEGSSLLGNSATAGYFTSTTTTTNTFPTVSSTNITATNATSSSKQNIPHGASPSVVTTGDIAIDTTSDQLVGFGGSAKKVYGNGNLYGSFTYATSTAWTGTTTLPLGTAFVAETWNGAQCYTDTGTVDVDFYHTATHVTPMLIASTTANTNVFSGNTTLTAGEKRYVDVGTPVSSPTKISCTISRSLTSD